MADDSSSDKEEPVSRKTIDERLKSLATAKDELSSKIAGDKEEAEKATQELSTAVDTNTSQVRDDITKFSKYLSDVVNSVNTSIKKSKETVQSSLAHAVDAIGFYHGVVRMCLIVIAGLALVLIGLYNLYYDLVFVTAWAIIYYVLDRRLRKGRKDLGTVASNFPLEVDSAISDASKRIQVPPTPVSSESAVSEKFARISHRMRELAEDTLELNPITKGLLSLNDKRKRQEVFGQGLALSLTRYGFKAEDLDTLSFSDDKEQWVKQASEQLAGRHAYPKSIFEIIFYDSVGLQSDVDAMWPTFRKEKDDVNKLARLLLANELIKPDIVNDQTTQAVAELLENMPFYSLREASLRCHAFFVELSEFKTKSLKHLGFYGLGIEEHEKEVKDFTPKAPAIAEWKDEVIRLEAGLLREAVEHVRLLVWDSMGDHDATKSAWKDVQGNNSFDALAKILVLKAISKPSLEIDPEVFRKHLKDVMKSLVDDYSLVRISQDVSKFEADLAKTRRVMNLTCSRFRLGVSNFEYISNFEPNDVRKVEVEVIDKTATKVDLDVELLNLLYRTLDGTDQIELKRLFKNVKEHDKIEMLSEKLISHGTIPKGPFSANLRLLLDVEETFDFDRIYLLYGKYERLIETSNAFFEYAKRHQVIRVSEALSVVEILRICPPDVRALHEDQLVSLADQTVVESVDGTTLEETMIKGLAIATSILYLKSAEDAGWRSLCAEYSEHPFAVKVLYCYHKLFDDELFKKNPVLVRAIPNAIKLPNDARYLGYYRSEMAHRSLPEKLSELTVAKLDTIGSDIRDVKDHLGIDADSTLKELGEPLEALMNDLLKDDVVKEFLTMQVLNTFVLTAPANEAIVKLINSGLPKKVAEEMGKPDWVRISEEKDIGRGIRLGLVPLGLSFEDYTKQLEPIFNEAEKMFNANPPKGQKALANPISSYIVRIFPSEESMKAILPRKPGKGPYDAVSEFVKSKLTAPERGRLLTVIRSGTETRSAFANLLSGLVNSDRAGLLVLRRKEILPVAEHHHELLTAFESKAIDRQLVVSHGANDFADMCLKVAYQVASTGRDEEKANFRARLLEVFPKHMRLSDEDENQLVDITFDEVLTIGKVIRAFL